jgi:hypothetical protein
MNRQCELCGVVSHDVLARLAWYRDAGVATRWRCADDAACQARLEATGEAWPLLTAAQARREFAVPRREP